MITELISSTEDVIQFIPQREPIVMVDCLYDIDIENLTAKSGLTIVEENIFVKNNKLSYGGVIEHIAQSIALKSGYMGNLKSGNGKSSKGYIAAVKNMKYLNNIRIGDKLITEIKVVTQFQQISVVDAEVRKGNDLMASAQLQIFQIIE